MATMKTRIVLKNDTLANWNADGSIILKQGEIGLARVDIDIAKDGEGNKITKPVYLMKVGDGKQAFSALEWLAAPASDVHAWAKKASLDAADLPDIPAAKIPTLTVDKLPALGISNITGLQDALDGKVESSVFEEFKTANTQAISDAVAAEAAIARAAEEANAGAIGALTDKVGEVPTDKTVVGMIEEAQQTATYDDTEIRNLINQKADSSQVTADIAAAKNALINTEIKSASDAAAAADEKADAAQETADEAKELGQNAATKTQLQDAQSALQTNIDAKLAIADFNEYKTANDAAVGANADEIKSLKSAVSSAMHFIGEKAEVPTSGEFADGDVILVGSKEYVYGTKVGTDQKGWIELGDEGSLATQQQLASLKSELEAEIDADVLVETNRAKAAEEANAAAAKAADDKAAAAQTDIDALEKVAIQTITSANGISVSGEGTARQIAISETDIFVLDCGTATTVE